MTYNEIQDLINEFKGHEQLRGQSWNELWNQLWDQLWDQPRGQLWDQLWGRSTDQLRAQLKKDLLND